MDAMRPMLALAALRNIISDNELPQDSPLARLREALVPSQGDADPTEDALRFLLLLQLLHTATQEGQDENGDGSDILVQLMQAISTSQSPRRDPATDEDVARLPRVRLQHTHLQHVDKRQCVICQDEFSLGSRVVQLPCGHVFCEQCIRRWLQQKKACPMCRRCVADVDPPRRFDVCALQQCGKGLCALEGTWWKANMIPLPNCSHNYHPTCALTLEGAALSRGVECQVKCALCRVPSMVSLPPSDVFRSAGGGICVPSVAPRSRGGNGSPTKHKKAKGEA
jgi:hypothetical protein